MKESKWFSAVILVILMGVNGASYLLMHANEVSSSVLLTLMIVLIALSVFYIIYLNRTRFRSKK